MGIQLAEIPRKYVSKDELQQQMEDLRATLDRHLEDRHRQNETILAAIDRMRPQHRGLPTPSGCRPGRCRTLVSGDGCAAPSTVALESGAAARHDQGAP